MNTTPRKYYDIDADATISANSAKKMTPIAQALKWVGEKYPNFNKADIEEYLTSLLEAEQGYASQQAPEGMYTREQVEKAVEFGFRQCKLQGYISPSQEQQFIQSLK